MARIISKPIVAYQRNDSDAPSRIRTGAHHSTRKYSSKLLMRPFNHFFPRALGLALPDLSRVARGLSARGHTSWVASAAGLTQPGI